MKQRQSIVVGILLILAGVGALLHSLGHEWVRMDRVWPLALIIGGLFALGTGFARDPRDAGAIWFGCAGALCGGLFLGVTVGLWEWGDLSWLWPAFPAIAGLAWLVAWGADLRQVSNLVAGLLALIVAVVGFLHTCGRLGAAYARVVASLWPLTLVVLGVGLIVQFLMQRR